MKKWNEISPFTGSSIGEDAPTNSAGSGSVAGLGVGPMGEPGVKKNIYFVDIPFVDNEIILPYFTEKRDRLVEHLASRTIPGKCNEEETWNGKKCEKYCEVRTLCPHI